MDAAEIEAYEAQLAQVHEALKSDRGNDELKALRDELENLIALSKSIGSEPSTSDVPNAPSTPQLPVDPSGSRSSSVGGSMSSGPDITPARGGGGATGQSHGPSMAPRASDRRHATRGSGFVVGEQVMALYPVDGRYYAARIVSVSGDPANPICTVIYHGYNSSETLASSSLNPLHPHPPPPPPPPPEHDVQPPPPTSDVPPPPPPPSDDAPVQPPSLDEKTRKKLRSEKKILRRQHQSDIQAAKASQWQSFAQSKRKSKPTFASPKHP